MWQGQVDQKPHEFDSDVKQLKRCIQGSPTDVSELSKKCAKPNSLYGQTMVKLWTEMMKGNISMENMLEISRQNGLGDADKDRKDNNVFDTVDIDADFDNDLNFDGEYLTANGVQLAISETFKQLKEHQPNSNNIEIEQVGFQISECDITKEIIFCYFKLS